MRPFRFGASLLAGFAALSFLVPLKGQTPTPTVVSPCPPSPGCPNYPTLPSGWNLVTGTAFIPGNPARYTFQAGDTGYEVVGSGESLQPTEGYWVYLNQPTGITVPYNSGPCRSLAVPAGQFIMIGNPFSGPASVAGVDVVFSYDPVAGQYKQGDRLEDGQGAWVYSAAGGTLTITPAFSQSIGSCL